MACQEVWKFEHSPPLAAEWAVVHFVVEDVGDHLSGGYLPEVPAREVWHVVEEGVCFPLQQSSGWDMLSFVSHASDSTWQVSPILVAQRISDAPSLQLVVFLGRLLPLA